MQIKSGFWSPSVRNRNGDILLRGYFPLTITRDDSGSVTGCYLDSTAYVMTPRVIDGNTVEVEVPIKLLPDEVASGDTSAVLKRIYSDPTIMSAVRRAGSERRATHGGE